MLSQQEKVRIGWAGKQYGLYKPPPRNPAPNAFGVDDDDAPLDAAAQRRQDAEAVKRQRQIEAERAKVLAEDPTAYAYDEVYDSLKQSAKKVTDKKEDERTRRKPKYIGALLKKAEERNMEQDIVYDRRQLKEREKEDHMFGGKDKFVTNAFKNDQMAKQKWLEDRAKQDAKDKDVSMDPNYRLSLFQGIYANRNVAMGGEVKDKEENEEKKEPQPKQEPQEKATHEPEGNQDTKATKKEDVKPTRREDGDRKPTKEHDAALREKDRDRGRDQDRGRGRDRESGRQRERGRDRHDRDDPRRDDRDSRDREHRHDKHEHRSKEETTKKEKRARETEEAEKAPPKADKKEQVKDDDEEELPAQPAKLVRRNDEASVEAARQRFLARKLAKGGGAA